MLNTNIAEFWYKLVKAGLKTLDDVPEKYRAEVERMLEEG